MWLWLFLVWFLIGGIHDGKHMFLPGMFDSCDFSSFPMRAVDLSVISFVLNTNRWDTCLIYYEDCVYELHSISWVCFLFCLILSSYYYNCHRWDMYYYSTSDSSHFAVLSKFLLQIVTNQRRPFPCLCFIKHFFYRSFHIILFLSSYIESALRLMGLYS